MCLLNIDSSHGANKRQCCLFKCHNHVDGKKDGAEENERYAYVYVCLCDCGKGKNNLIFK